MQDQNLQTANREMHYALEVADGIVRGSDEWLPLIVDQRERSLLVARMRKVSVAIRQTERLVEEDTARGILRAYDLIDALTICGETVTHDGVSELFGEAAEQVRYAVSDLRDAMRAEVVR